MSQLHWQRKNYHRQTIIKRSTKKFSVIIGAKAIYLEIHSVENKITDIIIIIAVVVNSFKKFDTKEKTP